MQRAVRWYYFRAFRPNAAVQDGVTREKEQGLENLKKKWAKQSFFIFCTL